MTRSRDDEMTRCDEMTRSRDHEMTRSRDDEMTRCDEMTRSRDDEMTIVHVSFFVCRF